MLNGVIAFGEPGALVSANRPVRRSAQGRPDERTRWRIGGSLLIVLLLAGCGNDRGANTAVTGSGSTLGETSTTIAPTTESRSPTTTTAVITSSTVSIDKSLSVPEGQTLNRIWFLHDEILTPAYREGITAEVAIRDLLTGPVSDDGVGVVTMIPEGTRLRSLSVADSVANVDLTGAFASGGGSPSMFGRVAQLVYTVTEFPRVDRVVLTLDGSTDLGGEGIILGVTLRREDFQEFKPSVVVTLPLPGQEVSTPFLVSGENSTFENTVDISLAADDGRELVTTFATGLGPTMDPQGKPAWGPFEASIAFDAGPSTGGEVTVTEATGSVEEGGRPMQFAVPVRFSSTPSPGLPGASADPVSTPDTPGGPGVTAELMDVRTGRHDGYERVVFEFSTDFAPGYTVGYVEGPITADPSDLPVSVSGDSYLSVRMSSAAGFETSGNTFHETYTGATSIPLAYPAIQSVVETGDFEGVLNWVIGVRTHPAFKVTTLSNPTRIVVDVASAGALL